VVQEPREKEIVESDTEEEEILEEQYAAPLSIRIPGARARGEKSGRSESVTRTSILVIMILSYIIGSRYTIYRGRFVTSIILAIWFRCL